MQMNKEDSWKKKYLKKLMIDGEDKEALDILLQNKPSKLFRFREGIIKNEKNEFCDICSLNSNTVWASSACKFNDPFDSSLVLSYNYHADKKDKAAVNAFEKFKKLSDNVQKHTYVTCYSENIKSLSLWSYYANNHEGFCIEYDFNKLMDIAPVFPVYYDNDLITMGEHSDNERSLWLYALTKSKDWSHEREWRRMWSEDLTKPGKKGEFIESIEPSAIYLGNRIEKNRELENQLIHYAKSNNIELYKMYMDIGSYTLIPLKL